MAPYILAADDDEYVRVLIETKLGSAYDLQTVADGAEAWDLLTDPDAPRPDLCIFDVMMPELDGFATLERLRGHAELADIPVGFDTHVGCCLSGSKIVG